MKAALISQKTHPSIPRRSPAERIEETIRQHNPNLIVAPEYFLNNEKRIYTKYEKEGLIQNIAEMSGEQLIIPGTILWQENGEMRNTAVALSNGKVIAEHDKSVDGGEALIAQSYGLEPAYGKWEPCTFSWKGLDVSLEICLEHGLKLLKEKGKKTDLQIVPGLGAEIRPHALHLKNNGYAIVCDGRRPHASNIMQGKGLLVPDYEQVERECRDNVYIYELFAGR